MPNKLVARMEGPHGTGLYRCEVTIETPRFITMETSKNVTVVGKINNVYAKTPFIFIKGSMIATIFFFGLSL